MSRRLLAIAGVAVSAAAMLWSARSIPIEQALDAMAAANLPLVLLAAAVFGLSVLASAISWYQLIEGRVSVRALFGLVSVRYAANNILPMRAGEFISLGMMTRQHPIGAGVAALSIGTARVIDGLMLLLCAMAGALLTGIVPAALIGQMLLAFIFLGIALATLLQLIIIGSVAARFTSVRLIQTIVTAARSVPPAALVRAAAWSLLSWSVDTIVWLLIARAFSLPIDFGGALLLCALVNLSCIVPTAPGALGVFEAVAVGTLGLLGIAPAAALAYAVVVHVAIWLPVTGGVVAWQGIKYGLGEVTRLRAGSEIERVRQVI